jgi:hypothetical protein
LVRSFCKFLTSFNWLLIDFTAAWKGLDFESSSRLIEVIQRNNEIKAIQQKNTPNNEVPVRYYYTVTSSTLTLKDLGFEQGKGMKTDY